MSTEKVIRKIRGLLAKAESTTPEEAEALTEKAASLMERHAIDRYLLEGSEPIEETELDVGGAYGMAYRDLSVLLGQSLGFAVVYDRGTGSVRWYGFSADLEMAEILWTSLLVQLERAAEAHMGEFTERHPGTGSPDRFYERRSFMSGWAITVSIRIGEVRKDESPGVYSRQLAVENWAGKNLSGRALRPVLRRLTPEGYADGRAAGSVADLGQIRELTDETDLTEDDLLRMWDRASET